MFAQALTNRQEIKRLREARKLKEKEILAYDLENNDVAIATNGTALILVLFGLICSGIVAITYDIALGIVLGIITLIIMFSAIFIEASIRTVCEIILDFYHEVFSINVNARRSYKESRKIVDYAIKNNKISDEHISLVLESLTTCAKIETDINMESRRVNLSNVIQEKHTTNVSNLPVINSTAKVVEEENNKKDNKKDDSKKGSKFKLKFEDDSIALLYSNGTEADKISYDEIIMPETQEQIQSMPYSTIYGYVEKEDKTIYIDMEQEIALVANK